MKRALAGLLTLGLLAACSVTVIVNLPDQTLPLTASNTVGKVIYPKDPLAFSPPPVQALRIVVTGEAELSPYAPLSLDVYARASAPLGCFGYSTIYVCDISPEDTYVGQIDLTKASRTSFTLGQQGGETLAQGVNQGRLWLGVKVGGTGSPNATLYLKKMTATVTARF